MRELTENSSSEAIIKAICALASSLELEVIAEGVETAQQYHQLLALDCRHFQGYLFGRPMPLAEFESWLAVHQPAQLYAQYRA